MRVYEPKFDFRRRIFKNDCTVFIKNSEPILKIQELFERY